MKDLTKRIEELEARLATGLARVEELKAQLQQISRNRSKSASSDLGHRKGLEAATDPKPGGQPGTTREMVSSENVNEVVDQDPEPGDINRVERIRRLAPIRKEIRQHRMTLRDHPHIRRQASMDTQPRPWLEAQTEVSVHCAKQSLGGGEG